MTRHPDSEVGQDPPRGVLGEEGNLAPARQPEGGQVAGHRADLRHRREPRVLLHGASADGLREPRGARSGLLVFVGVIEGGLHQNSRLSARQRVVEEYRGSSRIDQGSLARIACA